MATIEFQGKEYPIIPPPKREYVPDQRRFAGILFTRSGRGWVDEQGQFYTDEELALFSFPPGLSPSKEQLRQDDELLWGP